ncbi:adenosylcobinamide-phosphate synthase CbiB [Janibacter sp. G1551]|uniref:adenosylcobinamide-phosphate synthase CbiB n=1 Tax=Janibacter sp. G1551 TaxID=3420440 RepID=UPI003CFF343D
MSADRARGSAQIDPVGSGLVLGFVLDRLLGDPERLHPVAGFGQIALAVERRLWAPSRARGVAHEALLVTPVILLGALLTPGARPCGRAGTDLGQKAATALVVAGSTWVVLGGRSLEREADLLHGMLTRGELDAARDRVRHLVGRDPTELDADEVARACLESVAENTADAVVAPLFWGALAGAPGLLGYRAINTLDAMVGHRTERYRSFGWAAARVDDAANVLPARLTVLATALARPRALHAIARAVREDAPAHPSPNAGPVEAAAAAALGVRLGGANTYEGVAEDRGHLGRGPAPSATDIPRGTALLRSTTWISLGLVVVGRMLVRAARQRRLWS